MHEPSLGPYRGKGVPPLEPLMLAYLDENPEMPREEARARAVVLQEELHRLDRSWSRSQRRFRRKVVPVPGVPEHLLVSFITEGLGATSLVPSIGEAPL